MKSRLIAAWVTATAVAVMLAYQAVGLVQTQVTESAPVLAAVEATSTTISAEDLPPVPPTVTIPGVAEDRVDAPPVSQPDDQTDTSTEAATTAPETTTPPATTPSTTSPTTTAPAGSLDFIIPSDGGTVLVACTDDTISFSSALANPGFETRIKSEGPKEVSVEFGDLNDDRTFEIKASCRNGGVESEVHEDD
jgi:hypothetical protein